MVLHSVIIHERLGRWARQIRPRFRDWPIRWAETRSKSDLVGASARSGCPILVVEVDVRAARSLDELQAAIEVAPDALSLVLERQDRPEVVGMAREVGATLVMTGVVVPPEVDATIRRWLPIARQRAEAEGWSPVHGPEPEPWEDRDLFLAQVPPRDR